MTLPVGYFNNLVQDALEYLLLKSIIRKSKFGNGNESQ